jgi:uncharacterized protein YuzE
MKIEYDTVRDLLYVWLGKPGGKAARTETVGQVCLRTSIGPGG